MCFAFVDKSCVCFHLPLDDAVPCEAISDALAGACEQALEERAVAGDALESVCQGFGVFFGDKDSRLAVYNDIRDTAHVACDNREAEFHGLDEYDAQAFGVALVVDDGRQHEYVCSAVFIGEVFGRELAGEDDVRVLCSLLFEFLGEVAHADDTDFELVGRQEFRGVDEVADALALDVPPDKEDLEPAVYGVLRGAPARGGSG